MDDHNLHLKIKHFTVGKVCKQYCYQLQDDAPWKSMKWVGTDQDATKSTAYQTSHNPYSGASQLRGKHCPFTLFHLASPITSTVPVMYVQLRGGWK